MMSDLKNYRAPKRSGKNQMGLLDQEILLLNSQIGQKIGSSNWTIITQERINKFAKITEDPQFIHIDPDRAEKHGPFGKTIATLSATEIP